MATSARGTSADFPFGGYSWNTSLPRSINVQNIRFTNSPNLQMTRTENFGLDVDGSIMSVRDFFHEVGTSYDVLGNPSPFERVDRHIDILSFLGLSPWDVRILEGARKISVLDSNNPVPQDALVGFQYRELNHPRYVGVNDNNLFFFAQAFQLDTDPILSAPFPVSPTAPPFDCLNPPVPASVHQMDLSTPAFGEVEQACALNFGGNDYCVATQPFDVQVQQALAAKGW